MSHELINAMISIGLTIIAIWNGVSLIAIHQLKRESKRETKT